MDWVKSVLLFTIIFIVKTVVLGQTNTSFAPVQDLFYKNYYLLNAAKSDTSKAPEVVFGNRSLTGVFSGISENFLGFHATKATSQPLNQHGLGVYIHNSNQGEFIHNNRIYARYSWTTRLSVDKAVSLGVQVGVVNYQFEPSVASAGGSDIAPDLGIGIWFLSSNLQIGLAANQLLNSTLQPINEVYILNTYYNLMAKGRIDFTPFVFAELHARATYSSSLNFSAQLSPLVVIHDLLEVGVGYQYDKGMLSSLGLRGVKLGKGNLKFAVSYLLINTRKTFNFTDAVLEFFLGYAF